MNFAQNCMKYEDLDKHFIAPKTISPFYKNGIKIPRKLKKKVKNYCGINWTDHDNAQRLWYYMEKTNPNYKSFLIKQICNKNSRDENTQD